MTNAVPQYFDFVAAARDARLDASQVDRLIERWSVDYGSDRHLLELRLLRVCHAIETGACTFDEAIAPENKRISGFAA